jgi:predicted RNA polymerase sigma factor
MTDIAWIDVTLTSARPKALGALLRYFRDLDIAEEAFQEACLRAIRTWPDNGPPRDPVGMADLRWTQQRYRRRAKEGQRHRHCQTKS